MLGLLRGIEKGVSREGQAQRDFYSTVLGSKENHLDRLLNQIKYNQQMKYRKERDARQDFITDRAYDRGVLESDRTHQYRQDRARASDAQFDAVQALRERADTRAEEAHDSLYDPKTGLVPIRAKREGEIHDFNYGEGGYMLLRRQLFKNELDEHAANEEVRNLERQLREKQGKHNLNEGWNEALETESLKQDHIRAQIFNLRRPRTGTSGRSGPTWTQTRDITIESLAPIVSKYLEDEGEYHEWNPLKWQWWPPGIQTDRPFVSEDPNVISQVRLLRQVGGHLVEELINRGVDPQMALTMMPDYWDKILDKEKGILNRLKRTSQAAGYDQLEIRKVFRDEVYKGAMNYLRFGEYNRPEDASTSGADKFLDTEIPR